MAGMFYPEDRGELEEEVDRYLLRAHPSTGPAPKAIIAPHAGYVYSGPIAGSAYARVRPLRGTISRVVLLGPSHRVGFRGVAASCATAFRTPLGDVPVDREAVTALLRLPFVVEFDAAHRDEHGLEVHLPFLQKTLGRFSIVPLVVGDSTGEQVAQILDLLWGGPETLIVVSSDLSHYLSYDKAMMIDRETSDAIERLDPSKINFDQACGRIPVQGLLIEAKRHALTARTIDLRNSGDTAGDRRQVVGYGAYVFTPRS